MSLCDFPGADVAFDDRTNEGETIKIKQKLNSNHFGTINCEGAKISKF